MAESYGMKVWLDFQIKNMKKIQAEVKEKLGNVDMEAMLGKAKEASKQIQSSFGKIDLKGITKALSQKQGAVQKAGELGAESGTLGKLAATAGAVVGVLFVIKKIAQKALNEIVKSSPYLQGIMSVMSRAWTNVWRPFGDFLGNLLRPLAVALLKMSVKWLQFTRTETGEAVVKGASGAAAGAGIGAGVGAIAGGIAGGPIGALAGAGVGALTGAGIGASIALLGDAIEGTKNLATVASAWTDKLLETFGIDTDAMKTAVTTFFWVTIPEFFTEKIPQFISDSIDSMGNIGAWIWLKITGVLGPAWEKLKEFSTWVWDKITTSLATAWTKLGEFSGWIWDLITTALNSVSTKLGEFAVWLWEKVTSIWSWSKDLGQWLYDKITGALSNIGDKLVNIGQYMYNKVTSSISRAFENFKFGWSWGWSQGSHQTGANYIPRDGLYNLHAGEKVVNSSRTAREDKANSIIFNPSFTINATGAGVAEIESTIRNSTRMLEFEIRRRSLI